MKKVCTVLIFVAFSLILFGQNQKITFYEGVLTDSSYVNDSIGVSFKIAPAWYVWSKSEINELYKEAKKFTEGKVIIDNSSSVVFFLAKESQYGSYLQINDSFMFSVNGDYQSYQKLKDETAYLGYLQNAYKTLLSGQIDQPIEFSKIADREINKVVFKKLEMKVPLGDGKYIVEYHYVKKVSSFFYDFCIKFGTEEDTLPVESMVQSIKIR